MKTLAKSWCSVRNAFCLSVVHQEQLNAGDSFLRALTMPCPPGLCAVFFYRTSLQSPTVMTSASFAS